RNLPSSLSELICSHHLAFAFTEISNPSDLADAPGDTVAPRICSDVGHDVTSTASAMLNLSVVVWTLVPAAWAASGDRTSPTASAIIPTTIPTPRVPRTLIAILFTFALLS